MEKYNHILSKDEKELLGVLEQYQLDIINNFLEQTNGDYIESANKWLNATPSNTAKFGSQPSTSKLYQEKLLEEIEKFLCGDERYEEDRKKLNNTADTSSKFFISSMSAAIGSYLGVAGAFIAPVIVLLLISFGKMSINAWCEMRKSNRENL
ncbi:hypothetical protein H7F15_12135 [Pontibacter sp. Tf4]|uniref:hypothetical protein n=1 Tax=Pontibacter sp. Tf4 TaxID=2761620 RepID=UPI0016284FE4|nr:hypothetical protein [Pontibacter sp. Tf4]MBB6611791.1 hypothetical protein [Pontibacter sp. Tf4]